MILAMMIATKFPLLWQAVPANPEALTPEQFRQQIALEAVRHRAEGSYVAVLVPFAFFALVALLVWFGTRRRQAEIQARADFHKQLLDKFGSGREFAEFLESKGSQKFLDELWAQGGPRGRMLSGLQPGIVLAMLGLGFLGLSVSQHRFVVPGVIVLALGVGFLLSALVAHKLSKKLGTPDGGTDSGATLSRT